MDRTRARGADRGRARELQDRLRIDSKELDSMFRQLTSQFELSLRWLLTPMPRSRDEPTLRVETAATTTPHGRVGCRPARSRHALPECASPLTSGLVCALSHGLPGRILCEALAMPDPYPYSLSHSPRWLPRGRHAGCAQRGRSRDPVRRRDQSGRDGRRMKTMAAEPNHVSSVHDKLNAEMTLKQFTDWGWDAKIETFKCSTRRRSRSGSISWAGRASRRR